MVEQQKLDKEEKELEELEKKKDSSVGSLWDDIIENMRLEIRKKRLEEV